MAVLLMAATLLGVGLLVFWMESLSVLRAIERFTPNIIYRVRSQSSTHFPLACGIAKIRSAGTGISVYFFVPSSIFVEPGKSRSFPTRPSEGVASCRRSSASGYVNPRPRRQCCCSALKLAKSDSLGDGACGAMFLIS